MSSAPSWTFFGCEGASRPLSTSIALHAPPAALGTRVAPADAYLIGAYLISAILVSAFLVGASRAGAFLARAALRRGPERRKVLALALDATGAVLTAAREGLMSIAATFTVRWDPFGRGAAAVRLRGRCRYHAFRVSWAAGGEYERRALSWFYRWHDAPDDADWRAFLVRFGFDAPPGHALQLEDAAGVPDPVPVWVVSITPAAAGAVRGTRSLRRATPRHPEEGVPAILGPAPLGGLTPESFIAALDRAAAREAQKEEARAPLAGDMRAQMPLAGARA